MTRAWHTPHGVYVEQDPPRMPNAWWEALREVAIDQLGYRPVNVVVSVKESKA